MAADDARTGSGVAGAGPGSGAHRTGQVFLVSAARTPIGKSGGPLADTPATLGFGGGGSVAMAVERVAA